MDNGRTPSPSGGVLIVQRDGPAVVYWAAGYEQPARLIEGPPAELGGLAAEATAVAFLAPQNFVVAWQDPAGAAAIFPPGTVIAEAAIELLDALD